MINSMTGFGRAEYSDKNRKITVEIKAVNHRYLDLNMKMPKKMNAFESSIRNLLKNSIQRGKIDLYITYEDLTLNTVTVQYNETIATQYMQYLQKIADTFQIENEVKAGALSRYPDVFTLEEQTEDEEELWSALEQVIAQAVEQFVAARVKEGENLKDDLIGKCQDMLGYVDFIENKSPNIIDAYRAKLEEKVSQLLENVQMDAGRIATEVTLFADKICVDEETVRLRSHIQSTIDTLNKGGAVGRKLDFIAQEMNREANTILSKSNDLEISNVAIDLKTDIEKVREQIQNLE